jgi:hypothetical protein
MLPYAMPTAPTGVPIRTAAASLGVSVDTVRRRIRRGELETVRDARGWHLVILPDASSAARPMQPMAADDLPGADAVGMHRAAVDAELVQLRVKVEALTAERDWLRAVVEREQAAHGETRRLFGNLQAQMLALPAATVPATPPERAENPPAPAEAVQQPMRRWWRFWRA